MSSLLNLKITELYVFQYLNKTYVNFISQSFKAQILVFGFFLFAMFLQDMDGYGSLQILSFVALSKMFFAVSSDI